jgi:hypothetical protein
MNKQTFLKLLVLLRGEIMDMPFPLFFKEEGNKE